MKIKFGMERVHKIFTFQAYQNRIFAAYQMRGFLYNQNADRREFIKCLHFGRDKIAFSLPTKWRHFFINPNHRL